MPSSSQRAERVFKATSQMEGKCFFCENQGNCVRNSPELAARKRKNGPRHGRKNNFRNNNRIFNEIGESASTERDHPRNDQKIYFILMIK